MKVQSCLKTYTFQQPVLEKSIPYEKNGHLETLLKKQLHLQKLLIKILFKNIKII